VTTTGPVDGLMRNSEWPSQVTETLADAECTQTAGNNAARMAIAVLMASSPLVSTAWGSKLSSFLRQHVKVFTMPGRTPSALVICPGANGFWPPQACAVVEGAGE